MRYDQTRRIKSLFIRCMARGLLVRALVPLLFASRVAAQTAPPSCRGSPRPTPMISRARQSTPDRRRRVASCRRHSTRRRFRAPIGSSAARRILAERRLQHQHVAFVECPAAYYIRPNGGESDQVTLYIERHVDWGFRITNLYGLDYRYTTAKGIFSQQLLYLAAGHRGPARTGQVHIQPLAALHLRRLHADRRECDVARVAALDAPTRREWRE